jgi:virginiamycin A acetyltransferase
LLSILRFKLYAVKSRMLRKIIRALVTRLEDGQMYSEALRRIFLEYHNIEIGMYSYGAYFDLERIAPFTKIGRYCSFAHGVHVINDNHPLTRKSTHPFFYDPSFGYVNSELLLRQVIEIGNDVWIGRNALILPSVNKIGDGAVIGAGAIVTKDVPDFAVVAGNPAKVIKYRFSQETREKIKASHWWDKDIEQLKGDLHEFLRPVEAENDTIQTS